MTKVLYICGSMPPLRCGVGFYTNTLLDNSPIEFDLLTTEGLNGHKAARQNMFTPDWKIFRIPKIIKLCRQNPYDIIHLQYPAKGYGRQVGVNILPYFLRLFCKAKIVVTLHEYYASGLLGKFRDLVTILPAHEVIISNPYDKEALPSIISKKSRIIPIGSNLPLVKRNEKYFNKILAKAKFNRHKKVTIYFGFAHKSKGLETLIDAASFGDIQLLLVTKLEAVDEYQSSLLQRIDTAVSNGAKICTVGFLEDKELSEILQECNYFVIPQPLPLTAKSGTTIAAVMHGLLVFGKAADNTSYNMPYVNGINCVLIKNFTSENLHKELVKEYKTDSFSEGINELSNYFSWKEIWKEHLRLYGDVDE